MARAYPPRVHSGRLPAQRSLLTGEMDRQQGYLEQLAEWARQIQVAERFPLLPRPILRRCDSCTRLYELRRRNQRYCSDRCRTYANRLREAVA